MVDNGKVRALSRTADPGRAARRPGAPRPPLLPGAAAAVAVALAMLALLAAGAAPAAAQSFTGATRLIHAPGKLVPIPAAIPHEPGDMVDRRIVPDLRWIAARFPIYVTEGYSGPLPDGERVGCRGCHVRNSDHHHGLAVDIVPRVPSSRCDARWRGINRLARLAEPRQNRPRPPFRWVGYNGDSGHGCGHHLHLSWNHGPAPEFRLAPWVEALPASLTRGARPPQPPAPAPEAPPTEPTPAPSGPTGGAAGGAAPGPSGGVSQARTGGIGAG